LAEKKVENEPVKNSMKRIRLFKVVLNTGVGRSGDMVERAKKLIRDLTGLEPSSRSAKRTVKEFGIHRGEPIGIAVTLRGIKARELVKRLLESKNNQLKKKSFDITGNCSFGIKEHIEIPGVKYDPSIGIFGLDVSMVFERPGYRVARRRRATSKIGVQHRVTPEDTRLYLQKNMNIEVI
jgi:large subunit ribosomal protein L5